MNTPNTDPKKNESKKKDVDQLEDIISLDDLAPSDDVTGGSGNVTFGQRGRGAKKRPTATKKRTRKK